jgi:hypothetical protein
LNGTFGKLKLPELSVVVDRSNWLTGLCMVTVAPATTALEGSVTVPVTLAELPTWAKPAGAVTSIPKKTNKIPRNDFTNLINVSPIMNCSLAPSCAGSLDECENPHPPRFTVDAWGKIIEGNSD